MESVNEKEMEQQYGMEKEIESNETGLCSLTEQPKISHSLHATYFLLQDIWHLHIICI